MSLSRAGWTVFHRFIQKCHLGQKEALFLCLPGEKQAQLQDFPVTFGDPSESCDSTDILDQIHSSWLNSFVRNRPGDEIRLFISALNPEQAKGLKKSLLFTNALYPLSSIGKKYLRKTLFTELLEGKELLPESCLPEDPLNDLLRLSSKELFQLASFLGVRDLSVEMRLIIDTAKIKQILGALDHHEQLYLKTVNQQKEPIIFKPMGLVKWDGNQKTLKALLVQRGLNRLAKALHGRNESLLWIVTHKFDRELGKTLTTFCSPVDSKASSILSFQVADLIPNIQNLKL